MEALKRVVRDAAELGIKVLTVYAFSTENWRRPQNEVDFLMRLPNEYLKNELAELIANNVRLRLSGEADGLPPLTREAIEAALVETAGNTGMILNFALNYGSRREMVRVVQKIAALAAEGRLDPATIDEKTVESFLYTADLPDPDLFIRPGGETRLSNFLLWQAAYAELWFPKVYWPDFNRRHLLEAIAVYQDRERRYGGVRI
jgi:undecaprenyl diphosphate synthase